MCSSYILAREVLGMSYIHRSVCGSVFPEPRPAPAGGIKLHSISMAVVSNGEQHAVGSSASHVAITFTISHMDGTFSVSFRQTFEFYTSPHLSFPLFTS